MYTVYSMKISYLHVGPKFFCDPKIGFKSGSAGLDVGFKIVWCTASPNLLFSKSHHWRQKVAKVQNQNPWKATPDPSIPFWSQHPNPYCIPISWGVVMHSTFEYGAAQILQPSHYQQMQFLHLILLLLLLSLHLSPDKNAPCHFLNTSQDSNESCLYRKESPTMQETYWVYSVWITHNTLFPFEC